MGRGGEKMQERTHGEKGISSPPLTSTLQRSSALGTESLGSIKGGPLCPRKALKWEANLGDLASPQNTPR